MQTQTDAAALNEKICHKIASWISDLSNTDCHEKKHKLNDIEMHLNKFAQHQANSDSISKLKNQLNEEKAKNELELEKPERAGNATKFNRALANYQLRRDSLYLIKSYFLMKIKRTEQILFQVF